MSLTNDAAHGSRIICRGCGFDVADAGRKSRVENYFACVKTLFFTLTPVWKQVLPSQKGKLTDGEKL